VLGTAEDGGYYLVAMHRQHREIFKGIKWSTASVLKRYFKKHRKYKALLTD